MELSIIIPTHMRPAKIAMCVAHLARQSLGQDEYEVLVGSDGPDPFALRAAEAAWTEHGGKHLRTVECPREGLAAVRNRLIALARGRVLLSLNDDCYAQSDLLKTHADTQRFHREQGRGVIVSGFSAWMLQTPDRLFDRMLRETSMVFFYHLMNEADPSKDWGYRHAWGLNMSAPADAVRELGGFAVFPAKYGYEDNEMAWRLKQRFDMPVLYRAKAAVWHEHRMEPLEYLQREYKLGYAAWGFAGCSPECAADMFGRDIRDAGEIAYNREYIERERTAAQRALAAFRTTTDLASHAINMALSPEGIGALLNLVYQQHLPLKRWMWRQGVTAAADARPLDASAALAQLD